MDENIYTSPDTDAPATRSEHLDRDWRSIEGRRPSGREGEGPRVAELERTQDVVGNHTRGDIPLWFATPLGAALTF